MKKAAILVLVFMLGLTGCSTVTNVGRVNDLITEGETGLLFPYDDENAFTAAVRRLITDSALRAQMGRTGHQQVQRCRLEDVLPRVMELYLSAAKETNT